mgnify:CR=1 FL=1
MSPMRRELYPATWETISLRIRERAEWRCEWCGVQNGVVGYRDATGRFWTDVELDRSDGDHPLIGKLIKITLTVAHLGTPHPDGTPGDKHDKLDVRDENLAALCNRCHLNHDRDEHMANAAATRRRKREQAGQLTF